MFDVMELNKIHNLNCLDGMKKLKDGVALTDVWEINALPHNSLEKTNHPSQKPLEIMERIILIGSNENDIVLDPFMGSGTTAISCIKLNRKYIGFETTKQYIDIFENRKNKLLNI